MNIDESMNFGKTATIDEMLDKWKGIYDIFEINHFCSLAICTDVPIKAVEPIRGGQQYRICKEPFDGIQRIQIYPYRPVQYKPESTDKLS